jgi:hypothetical protein
MAKLGMAIPAIRTAVFGNATKLTMAGLAQRSTYQARNLDYKSRAPFPAEPPTANITSKKVKL